MSDSNSASKVDVRKAVKEILASVDREREREIISRRFGLYDRKETLEQIGELLGITRERVRQLEKAILARLKAQAEENLTQMDKVKADFETKLKEMGNIAKISDLAQKFNPDRNDRDDAHVAFLATLAPNLLVIDENDDFNHAVAIGAQADESKVKKLIESIVKAVSKHGQPMTISELEEQVKTGSDQITQAHASVSRKLGHLKNNWGLMKWPTVNPKNIRDKIYVILQESGKPLHFTEIAKEIRSSNFKRKDVTTQAIHNELIKDGRFVLIGRGIYALKEWGYKKGTVADTIADVLNEEGKPLHRDEIVKRVLKSRQVKETTILLNLQGKPQFKRVAKATYALEQ